MTDFTVDIGGLDALTKNLDRTTENIESEVISAVIVVRGRDDTGNSSI